MKAIDYIAILIRITSIALFLYGVTQLASLLPWLFGEGAANDMSPHLALSVMVTLVPLFLAIVLWLFPFTLAKKLYPVSQEKIIEPIQPVAVLAVLLIAIGIYSLYSAFFDAVYWMSFVSILNKANIYTDTSLNYEHKASMITTGVELAVSLILIAKAKSIAYWLFRMAR